jgi:hypothetical protein
MVTWGHEAADGPALLAFAKVAAEAVGVKLSDDAVRERLRRVLKWRTG